MSRIAQILAMNSGNANARTAEADYIRVIREEGSRLTPQQAADASNEELLDMMETLRRQKSK